MDLQQPNIMVMLKVKELYPDRLAPVALVDEETDLWSAALVEVNPVNLDLGDTIYDLDNYSYKTDKEALKDLDTFLKFVMDAMLVMSN